MLQISLRDQWRKVEKVRDSLTVEDTSMENNPLVKENLETLKYIKSYADMISNKRENYLSQIDQNYKMLSQIEKDL